MVRKIIYISIAILVSYILYITFTIMYYIHDLNHEDYKKYTWILKDSIKVRVNPYFSGSQIGRSDIYNFMRYDKDYFIIIWEFKNTEIKSVEDVSINLQRDLGDAKISLGETAKVSLRPEGEQ